MRDVIYKIKGLELNKLKQDFPLEKWFYQMVQKKEKDLTIKDISHMFRQEVYLDLAVPIAWNIIVDDPLCGELYEGQMIELLTRVFINKPELREKEKYLSFEKKWKKCINSMSGRMSMKKKNLGKFFVHLDVYLSNRLRVF